MKIVNIGSANIDNVYTVDAFLKPGETKACAGFSVYCGGKGLNQSMAVAKTGSEVWHAGLMGDDGDMLLEELQRGGVNTELVRRVPGRGGHTMIVVDGQGQNCILLYGGSNQKFTHEYVDAVLQQCRQGDVVLLQNEINLVEDIIEKAYARGLRVVLNAAPMTAQVGEYGLEKLALLLVNELEGAQLTGCLPSEPEKMLDIFAERWPGMDVVLTLGQRGACCQMGGERHAVGVFEVPVVDTTAAGDTFTGYFLHGWVQGLSAGEALQLASAASALCVGRAGASASVPTLAEVNTALEQGLLGSMTKGVF